MQATLTFEELETRWAEIEPSPRKMTAACEMIVRRPARDERELLDSAIFTAEGGLAGDDWLRRGADPDAQITLMNSRLIHHAGGRQITLGGSR